MTFDEQVAALRMTVPPKQTQKRKSDCTPAEWAAKLEYARLQWAALDSSTRARRVATMTGWNARHGTQRRAYFRQYDKRRRREDVQYRLRRSMSHRMRSVIRAHLSGVVVKPASTMQLVGCTIGELTQHIESQFLPGMTWDNWGNGEGRWHIDHVLPLSAVDCTDASHLKAVCQWRNLRPVWCMDNLKKGKTIDNDLIRTHFIGDNT